MLICHLRARFLKICSKNVQPFNYWHISVKSKMNLVCVAQGDMCDYKPVKQYFAKLTQLLSIYVNEYYWTIFALLKFCTRTRGLKYAMRKMHMYSQCCDNETSKDLRR